MKKIGLFYSKNAANTTAVAKQIQQAFGNTAVDLIPVEEAWQKDFEDCDCIIAGTATWFDGELPSAWDEMIPILNTLKLQGKKVAIFGLGDQINYPDNFVDGIGLLARAFESAGATLTGSTATDGYRFGQSLALKADRFDGLVIDVDNQADETEKRIQNWVDSLKIAFQ